MSWHIRLVWDTSLRLAWLMVSLGIGQGSPASAITLARHPWFWHVCFIYEFGALFSIVVQYFGPKEYSDVCLFTWLDEASVGGCLGCPSAG